MSENQNPTPDIASLDPEALAALEEMRQAETFQAAPPQIAEHELELTDDDPPVVQAQAEEKPNYTVQVPYSHPIADDEFDYGATEMLFVPSGTVKHTTEKLQNLPKEEIASSQQGKEFIGVVSASLETNTYEEGLVSTVLDPDAHFVQGVASDEGILTAGKPSFKTKEGVKLTGEKARLRVRQALNLGAIFNIPLWHSGFWLRIKAPSESELLELYRQITADKISLGRATYGLLFSNNTSYSSRALLDFCVDHIYETSLALKENEDIRQYIATPDLSILFWGLACSVWPNGFQYARPCIADPEKCNHIIKEKLDLSKLQFTNTNALTKWQISHMTKRQRGAMSVESVQRYRDEFIKGKPRKVDLSTEVKITFKIPSALEHIDAGYRWINGIEENYGKALTQDENKRDAYLISQGKATVMRQYTHFVKEIEVSGDVFDDEETIEKLLDDLTASDEIRNEFMDAVAKYVDDSVVSLIAIPTFTCPSCNSKQKSTKENVRFPELIPLDVNNTFFTLAVQKIQRIEAR